MIKNLLPIIFGIISLIAIINSIGCRPECNDSQRYDTVPLPGGGTAISDTLADTLEQHFIVKYLDSARIQKCYFSKKAIDHLFAKHPTANALGCSYALQNDSLKIIINVYRIAQTEIDIPAYLDSTYILSKTYCPPTCPPPAPK